MADETQVVSSARGAGQEPRCCPFCGADIEATSRDVWLEVGEAPGDTEGLGAGWEGDEYVCKQDPAHLFYL